MRSRKEDYTFLNDLGSDRAGVDEYKGSRKIVGRLKRAFIKRAEQVDSVARSMSQAPYPVIVCGDFNDTPVSYAYNTLSKKLTDTFLESGTGWGKTYIGVFPSYRIDYILHSKYFQSYEFTTHKEKLSDHYAISCKIVPQKKFN